MKLDYRIEDGVLKVTRHGLRNADGSINPWMIPTYEEIVQNAKIRDALYALGGPKLTGDFTKDLFAEIAYRFETSANLGELLISKGDDGELVWFGVSSIDCGL